jgi:AraC-like DNA-binding protein
VITPRRIAAGAGWRITEFLCDAGPEDRAFEERHREIGIALVVGGTFRYRSAQGSAVLAPGSLLLGNSGACFECGHEHSRGDRCVSFQFTQEFFEPIVAAVPAARSIAFSLPSLPPVEPLLSVLAQVQNLARMKTVDTNVALDIALRLAGEVCGVLADHKSISLGPRARDARRIAASLHRIEAAGGNRLALEDLAREARMSPFHFLRTFEEVVGTTPGRYILRMRLRRAAVRLLESTEPVSTVAYEYGFGDLSTFNRQFRRAMGVSPGQFRLTTAPAARLRATPPVLAHARPRPVSVRNGRPAAKAD